MTYLNIKTTEGVETIDSFETYKEAYKMAKEYRLASSYYGGVYLSQRSTKNYKN